MKRHGAEAPIRAAMNADTMFDKGDLDGRAVWLRILRSIEVLVEKRPGDGTAVH